METIDINKFANPSFWNNIPDETKMHNINHLVTVRSEFFFELVRDANIPEANNPEFIKRRKHLLDAIKTADAILLAIEANLSVLH